MRSNAEVGTDDEVSAELTSLLARLGELATGAGETGVPDAVRVDRLALMEKLRGALVAAQHGEMIGFARGQVEAQQEHIVSGRLDPAALGRGIADQIALACRVSPTTGSRRLGTARALHAELPCTRALLREGAISEDTAEKVVSETRHLDPERRRLVDERLAEAGIDQLSPRRAAALARRRAYEADPAGYTERGRTARKDRRVTLRPAPDTMSVLSGLLPVEQGVACIAALRRHADAVIAAGDPRTRDQIQADALVERLTGQAQARDVNVEVGITIPFDALIDPDSDAPAEVVGHGPLPAGIARDLLSGTAGRRSWRRLFTAPGDGSLIGGDPRRRRFDGFLAHLIGVRDHGRCRDPFCDAPIRHTDHIRPARAGGPTSSKGSTPIGGAGCASGATRSARCRAGTSTSSTTASTANHTRSGRRPPPDTPTSAGPVHDLRGRATGRGDGRHGRPLGRRRRIRWCRPGRSGRRRGWSRCRARSGRATSRPSPSEPPPPRAPAA